MRKKLSIHRLLVNSNKCTEGLRIEIIPILTGALGPIPHGLKTNLQRLGIQKAETTALKDRIQKAGLLGTVKILKTILNM